VHFVRFVVQRRDRNGFASTGPDRAVPDEARTDKRGFAVVNASELLERLAYYGVVSINGLFLLQLGFGGLVVGLVSGILLAMPYVVPMVAGPLAERAGYRPVMLLAFVAYAAGFLLIAASPTAPGFVFGALLVGTGAGMFKPLTAAAIAHVTSPEHRTFGYNVYYVGINVGGFIGPILIRGLFGEHYRLAYLLGASVIAVDFLFILALFRNPLPPRPEMRVRDAFRPLGEVLENRRFLALLAIFAGFWFVYSMALSFLIPYLQSYVALPSWFKPNWQVSLESLCVIALGIPLGGLASRRDGVRMMALGIVLLVLGFLVIGFVPAFVPYVLGVVLVAAGEVLAYPGFLSYVSRIAPRDRVAVYQGYGFLPLFAGFLVGPIVGGWLYQSLLVQARRPALFWAIMDCVGVAALAAFLLYARAVRAKPERGAAAAPPPAAVGAPWWQGYGGAAAVLVAGALVVLAGLAAGSRVPLATGGAEPADALPTGKEIAAFQGTTAEGRSTSQSISFPAGVPGNVTVTLTWTDTPPASPVPGAFNQPDRFRLEVKDAFGTTLARAEGENPVGGEGRVTASFDPPASPSQATVTVTLLAAGDTQAGPLAASPDDGNDWTFRAAVA
jgi:MFS family permease